jgi:hypothetical protein
MSPVGKRTRQLALRLKKTLSYMNSDKQKKLRHANFTAIAKKRE